MDVKTHTSSKGARASRTAAAIDGAYYEQRFNEFSGRAFAMLGKALAGAVLLVLAAVVLAVLSLTGWLYGVWQNKRLSGMPSAIVNANANANTTRLQSTRDEGGSHR